MTAVRDLAVDESRIKKIVRSGLPLTITTFTLPHEDEVYIEQVLTIFLKEVGHEKLKDYIVYCVRELAVNAKKANTKRVYFREQGLDISDPDDYYIGMAGFKENTLNNIARYLQKQKAQGLYVKVILQIKNNIINVEVRNNAVMTKPELARIQDKLARSRQYLSLEDALSQVLDDSEGAGLGLVILVLMLKKMGLGEDSFDILGADKETVARIVIPWSRPGLTASRNSFPADSGGRIGGNKSLGCSSALLVTNAFYGGGEDVLHFFAGFKVAVKFKFGDDLRFVHYFKPVP
ncbi:hypothetical protein FACS1894163_01880 [Spirochaetia bacterium]|nr:hypothetical protein FACS1894163_01880 [Spirochaetia bacterium]